MLALVVCPAAFSSVAVTASAQASTPEQLQYANETLAMHYPQYVQRADSFRAAGCEQPPWRRGAGTQCHKPPPYDALDWSTDGCSRTPPPARNVFDRPCQLHDFGYRNFGQGLSLGRSEPMRKAIDVRFRDEMYRTCRDPVAVVPFGGYARCLLVASAMYAVVRKRNDWSKPGWSPGQSGGGPQGPPSPAP
jgi:hypothetical protein